MIGSAQLVQEAGGGCAELQPCNLLFWNPESWHLLCLFGRIQAKHSSDESTNTEIRLRTDLNTILHLGNSGLLQKIPSRWHDI